MAYTGKKEGGMPKDARRRFTDKQARQLLVLADERCERCGTSLVGRDYHVHHKKPHSLGGVTVVTNGMVLCVNCHKEVHREA